ncbi:hypothetical protein Xsto_03850 [Xenorhabdus stockiae]|uniref:Uncharacterized protein n=1 Tax=Xenorhabdus stockiae TaxID=351614 RepID=A0A2D0KAU3_9GAMM|nr:hypothetical protein [Xenorhabdus stockiae]PHM60594.1 hypothetical protein Xsto_03850 [Xenorhabdus stockiae]
MTITYNDIREKTAKVKEEREAKINLIYSEAFVLIEAYKHSLGLKKDDVWFNLNGEPKPYVMTGLLGDEQFQKLPLTSIELTPEYHLKFIIGTVTDDTPRGGSASLVEIELFVDGHQMTAKVGAGSKKFPIFDGDRTNICDAIKDEVMMMINDANFRG